MNLILYIFFPFFAFLHSLKNFATKQSGIIFVLFSALYGYCFTFKITTADSFRTALGFYLTEPRLIADIVESYSEGGITDIFKPVTYSITKLFTDNPKILFALYGFLFGLFCYLSIKILVRERVGKNDLYLIVLMIMFFSVNSIVNINGIRFWLATWVFFYFCVQYFLYSNKMAIVGLFAVTLVHFAYLVIIIYVVLLKKLYLSFFRRNPLKVLFILFIISFFASFILPESTIRNTIGEDVTEMAALNRKYSAYTDMSVSYSRRGNDLYSQTNIAFTNYSQYAAKTMAFILCIIIYRRFKNLAKSSTTTTLFILVLAFFSFSFLSSSLMHSGGRYLIMSWLFLLYLLFRIYNQNREKIWQRCIIALLPTVALYYFILIVFIGYRLVTPMLWFMNIPYLIYDGIGFGRELLSY